ncbi:hypothetical protein BOTBODRAFT_46186 [Botryobasidium botryosum FD-172 SS1]|uniref:Alpha-type protein kinase domain-containing protein n=1 Tax=Botryobasidium botryosum (strain FD-172 SS1) TaxID=930990 RepID=A0A067MJL4_BOTB1|nr:hypothetical protein BOTBODRAFT_46186 [Botryobasidium botryosum FD-172 SS1]
MDREFHVWFRDPLTVLRNMLANPDFKGKVDEAPFQEFSSEGKRQWWDFMSGNWSWRIADIIIKECRLENVDGVSLVPIILGSNKTTTSVGTGNTEFHPLYLLFGNAHNELCRSHRGALLPIAFLAIPKTGNEHEKGLAFCTFRRQLFHTSLSFILSLLKPGMLSPVVMRWPDGHLRRSIFNLAIYIADYPEQSLIASIMYCQFTGFGWVTSIIAAAPPFPELRCFAEGRNFKQWTGDDCKALMKVYLPCLVGHLPTEIIRTLRYFMDFYYILQRKSHDEGMLPELSSALTNFHTAREIFRASGVRPTGFSLPREHLLGHHADMITKFGSPMGYCSSITEAKHIVAVKEPWRRSNRNDPVSQMDQTNQRLDKLEVARAEFAARGMLHGTAYTAALAEATGMPNQADIEGENDNGGPLFDPNVLADVRLAQRSQPGYPSSVDALGAFVGFPNLHVCIQRFLFSELHPNDPCPLDDLPLEDLPLFYSPISVRASAIATFRSPNDLLGMNGMKRERIRAVPLWRGEYKCHDCVFIEHDATKPGMQEYPCALVSWFSNVGDAPNSDTECSKIFPRMEGDPCQKCIKKSKASSQAEIDTIDQMNQCTVCGLVYRYMIPGACQVCASASNATLPPGNPQATSETDSLGDRSLASNVFQRAQVHMASASKTRLKLGAAKKEVAAPGLTGAVIRSKRAENNTQVHSDSIKVSYAVWSCPVKGKPEQLHNVLETVEKFPSTTSMREVLHAIYHGVMLAVDSHRKTHDIPPLTRFAGPSYAPWQAIAYFDSLLRDSVTYGIQKGEDLSACFLYLCEMDQLSTADIKERRIPLRVQIMVSQLLQSAADNAIFISSSSDELWDSTKALSQLDYTDDEHEEDTSETGNGNSISNANTTPPSVSEISEPPLKVQILSSQIQSLASHRTMGAFPPPPLRANSVEHLNTIPAACTGYKSLYRPNKLVVSATKVQFTNFEVCRTTATVSDDGDVFTSEAARVETIGIAKEWRASSEYGLVGKGQFKQAVTALYDSRLYAVSWFHPRTASDVLTHKENKTWLLSEFRLLHLGGFMMASFHERACMKFHTEGSFLAEISSRTLPDFHSADCHEALAKELVPTNHFLATVLLPTKGEAFEKFSGTEEAGHGTTALGKALDAFAHHTFVESAADMVFVDLQGAYNCEGTFCLADPQAHRGHMCSDVCRDLGLPPLKEDVSVVELLAKFSPLFNED